MNLVASLGQGTRLPVEDEQAPKPRARRTPYRTLDGWPRTRAMLAAADRPIPASEIAKALGVETKIVLNALSYHSAEVERTGERGHYTWALRRAA